MTIQTYFNPGCALSIYKPEMENKIINFLNQNYKETAMHKICCRHEPQLEKRSLIINVCAVASQKPVTLNINHIFKQLILDYFDLHVEIIVDYLKDEKFSDSDTKLF